LAGPNYWPAPNWPALIWPWTKLAFGQLGPKFDQDSPKQEIEDEKVEATVIGW